MADTRVVAELTENDATPQFAAVIQAPADTTDIDGRFTITDLLDGTYALRAARRPASTAPCLAFMQAATTSR